MSTEHSVPVFKPLLEAEEQDAAAEALRNGWLGMGKYVGDFESALQQLIGATDRHVVAVSTGHAALHLSLLLAEVGPGDEVITPSFNNIADHQAILATGASPVFCDIDPDTLCIDVDRAAELVTSRTRAVIAMDYSSQLADHTAVQSLAEQAGLRVIHDAAHTLGSSRDGDMVGAFSDITMFSFDPVKTITTIDGGGIVVQTEAEVERLHEMRLIGMGQPASVMYQNQRAWTYDVKRLGFRYHLANLHAAIGLAQLEKFERIAATRARTFAELRAALVDLDWLAVPPPLPDTVVPFSFYVRVRDGARERFRVHVTEHGVDTGIHWQPGHWFSLYGDCRRGPLPVTEAVGQEIVTLPLHSDMADEDVQRVVTAVRSFGAAG